MAKSLKEILAGPSTRTDEPLSEEARAMQEQAARDGISWPFDNTQRTALYAAADEMSGLPPGTTLRWMRDLAARKKFKELENNEGKKS